MSRQDPGSLGGFGKDLNNAGHRQTGTNKLIYGDAVTPGSSGGNTSFNPATGQSHYTSYENTPAASTPASASAAPTKKKSSGGSSKSSTGYVPGWSAEQAAAEAARKNARAPAAPAGGAMDGLSGASGFAAGGLGASGGGGGGVGAAGTSSSFAGLMGAMGEEGGNMPFAPPEALGLRAGLGQRAYPTPNLALAMLGKAY